MMKLMVLSQRGSTYGDDEKSLFSGVNYISPGFSRKIDFMKQKEA